MPQGKHYAESWKGRWRSINTRFFPLLSRFFSRFFKFFGIVKKIFYNFRPKFIEKFRKKLTNVFHYFLQNCTSGDWKNFSVFQNFNIFKKKVKISKKIQIFQFLKNSFFFQNLRFFQIWVFSKFSCFLKNFMFWKIFFFLKFFTFSIFFIFGFKNSQFPFILEVIWIDFIFKIKTMLSINFEVCGIFCKQRL